MRPKGHTNVLSFNIGTYETAPARRDAYIKAAHKAGFWSLGAWCRSVLDKAAKHKSKERRSWNSLVVLMFLAYLFFPQPCFSDCWQDALPICARSPDLCETLSKACKDSAAWYGSSQENDSNPNEEALRKEDQKLQDIEWKLDDIQREQREHRLREDSDFRR